MSLTELYNKVMGKYREPILYIFFGGLTTIISWVSYAAFVWMGIEINISNILSWICGVLFAFVTNKWFVFTSKDTSAKVVLYELGSFFSARIFTGVIAWILFPILIFIGLDQVIFNTEGLLAKIITSIVEIILNWVFSKYVVFRKNRKESSSDDEQ